MESPRTKNEGNRLAGGSALPHGRPIGHTVPMARGIRMLAAGILAAAALAAPISSASASEEILSAASYADMSTYSCRSGPYLMQPGQNLNLFRGLNSTCPNAQKLSGPGPANPFGNSSGTLGYITRFQPNMVEIKGDGSTVTPRVDDLHLHHVVWLCDGCGDQDRGQIRFAAGEEKTYVKAPQGYGYAVYGGSNWGLNYMIHDLRDIPNRQIYIEWEIDWTPASSTSGQNITPLYGKWIDAAGDNVYPVFDAEKGFANTSDGKFTFPEEVPTSPTQAGYEERGKIATQNNGWVVDGNKTLVFGAGHLHPGGLYVDLKVRRDLNTDGDRTDPGEEKLVFRSDARYYEPAGAVSWDVAMKATRPTWRIELKPGDEVRVSATYDVSKASWYESMAIMPVGYVPGHNEAGSADPWDDASQAQAMLDAGGILTHGQLPENVDDKANKPLGLADPRKLKNGRLVPASGIRLIDSFFTLGGFSATRGFPAASMRPPVIRPGQDVTFTNLDALSTSSVFNQTWHTITSCAAPCNRGPGIGYPLAGGPVKFDSGQLGYASFGEQPQDRYTQEGVVTGSNRFTTPVFRKPGTYSYFCRIHPFMRGSFRVAAANRK